MNRSLRKFTISLLLVAPMTFSSVLNTYAQETEDEIVEDIVEEDVKTNDEGIETPEGENEIVEQPSNQCGDGVTWSFNNGELRIIGSGNMYAYSVDNPAPWFSYASSIKSIVVDSMVTGMDVNALNGCTDYVVHCISGSVTEQFCVNNGIPVIAHTQEACLDSHEITLVDAKEPTCMEEGYTGDEVCASCGTVIKQGQSIEIVDHKLEVRDAKEATYLEEGYTGDSYCVYCNELIEKGKVIPKLMAKNKWVSVDGTWYHFDTKGNLDTNKWIQGASNGKWYYVDASGVMVTSGIHKDTKGKAYAFNEDGVMVTGWQKLDGYWYYFNENMKTDWQKINNKWYYFDKDGIMQTGKIEDSTNTTYYLDSNGAMYKGWKQIDGQWYYFYSDMKIDWQKISNKWYYFDKDGIMQTGKITDSKKKTYYLDSNGAMYKGWKQLDNQWYYFYSEMKTGWQKVDSKWYFMDDVGVMQTGTVTVKGVVYWLTDSGAAATCWYKEGSKWVYYKDGVINKGFVDVDGKCYYCGNDGYLVIGKFTVGNASYSTNSGGNITSVSVKGTYYYSQLDGRWSNKYYGYLNMASSGCVPTSLAMAFSTIKHKQILPTEVASYLYNNTTEFNKSCMGTTGMGVQYAAKKYGVSYKGLSSITQIKNALQKGKVVVCAVSGSSPFTVYPYTHEIMLYGYNSGSTRVYDPYNSYLNGSYSINSLWNWRSYDPIDTKGGYVFYALG